MSEQSGLLLAQLEMYQPTTYSRPVLREQLISPFLLPWRLAPRMLEYGLGKADHPPFSS
ncbi:MAG: hypothetical protein WCO21_03075 [bacterium]